MTEGRPGEEKESILSGYRFTRTSESLSFPVTQFVLINHSFHGERADPFNHRVSDTATTLFSLLSPAPAAGCQLDLHLFLLFDPSSANAFPPHLMNDPCSVVAGSQRRERERERGGR